MFISEHYPVLNHGGHPRGERANLICGAVYVDEPAGRELLRRLPPLLLMSAANDTAAVRTQPLHPLSAELPQTRTGSVSVATLLAGILVIQALRLWIARNSVDGWVVALRNMPIGGASRPSSGHPVPPDSGEPR